MVNQILIATTMVRRSQLDFYVTDGGCTFCLHMKVGMVEGLLYGHKAGLDLNQVIEAVGKGAAGSWYAPARTESDPAHIMGNTGVSTTWGLAL